VFRGAPNSAEELNVRVEVTLLAVVDRTGIVVSLGEAVMRAAKGEEPARRRANGDCVARGVDVRTVEKRRVELRRARFCGDGRFLR